SVLANEVAIARLVDEGLARRGVVVNRDVITGVLTSPTAGTLTNGQQRAITGVCGDGRQVSVVLGLAGTGKTTATRFAADAYTVAGYRVLGAATSGQAARTLGADAGIDSRTVASLRWNLEHHRLRLTPKTVLVLDEAGMTDDPDMVFVLAAAQHYGAKVILVGDDRQLGPVGPGGAFGAILDRHRDAVYVLDDNIRQNDPNEAAALEQLRDGDATEAVSWYAGHGRVNPQPDRETALAATVDAWLADVSAGHDTAMYAWKRNHVAALNQLARAAWADSGHLHGPEITAPGGRRYRAGDLVIALGPAQGRLVTSERGTVTAVDQRSGEVHVETVDQRRVTLNREETGSDRLDHAYAVTVHRAQGATVDRAHRLEDGGGRELAYVALSRAREQTTVHVVADDLDQAVEHLNDLWHRDARPRWAIDQSMPDNLTHQGHRIDAVMTAADQARSRVLAMLDPDQHVRDLHRQLRALEENRAELLRGEGPWEHSPVGNAVRAADNAQVAARDAYRRATAPGASRWERRRWTKEHERRLQGLTASVAERDQLLEPELAPLDRAVDDLRTEHEAAQLDATTRRLAGRLRQLGVGVSAEPVTAARGRHEPEIDHGPDLGW
ncbi:MAG TPA: AAA family ATPase, partial [Acidimicrobiia bacterium]|nr:AAA family ATPase [Acidimicrobiia bacterium]